MPLFQPEDIEKKILLILKLLNEAQEPLGSRVLARRMQDDGVMLSERTVRYHLKLMDERGLTTLVGRHDGRVITALGLEELGNARVRDKVGMAVSRIEVLAFGTTFDPAKRQGLLPVNVSLFGKDRFAEALQAMAPAFQRRLFVSELVAVVAEGGRIGAIAIPAGKVGLATVCSIVINGVLLKNGIPMDSKFGGILQIRNGKPLRFVELIHYSGTSLDPSEIFIRGRMTSVRTIIERGEGKMLANFREIPAPSRDLVVRLVENLRRAGIEGVLSIGEISEPVCQVPVDVNKVGMILVGGLNPVASVHEVGLEADNQAMSTVLDYNDLENYWHVLEKYPCG
jgi:HTH-type transcriptional regulator, global nitrogen regulator NrpRI